MKIAFTDFEFSHAFSERQGSSTYGEYVFHVLTAWNELVIDDETRLYCEYQTGNFYEHNDYKYPTNTMALYYPHCHKVIRMIDELGELWFEEFSDEKQQTLDEIKELCPALNTFEKVEQVYLALRDNVPSVDDFIETSEDVEDYEEDEQGKLTLKYYMNPATGSVDIASKWRADFESRDDQDQSWAEWGGWSLIEVKKDETGSWVELVKNK